jgi:hypothetical protein
MEASSSHGHVRAQGIAPRQELLFHTILIAPQNTVWNTRFKIGMA